MDGTGELFTEFLSHVDGDYLVIPLPEHAPQDHASLAQVIYKQLPQQDYILLAESFSGGIVPELLKLGPIHIKGVIFVASFLSSPNKYLLPIAKRLPIKALASSPISIIFHKLLFLGRGASKALVSNFVKVIKSIPDEILKNRLEVMSKQVLPQVTFELPTLYIQALSDKLISANKSQEVSKIFNHIEFKTIAGPHFVLQTKPKECALVVNQFIQSGQS
ncbi:serine aminopeptidase domain-containing protein [Pseudocolwellia sp. HL-MZ7]|uniref:serine aminopeptidase domain-containing protein n=1 Tax=Pseudocolwellia sp. HL-MZ7 TaxID=3400627 RepID=UPI003CF07B03